MSLELAGARRQAAELVSLIDALLQRAGAGIGDLAGIVVADGPGSFTGLRVGWAAAKGLAHERNLPLWTAPSLLALAFAAWSAAGLAPGVPVVACYDALRGQVFAAMYAFAAHAVETLVPPGLMTVAELARVAPRRPVLVAGDGARVHGDALYAWTGHRPDPAGVAGTMRHTAGALLALAGWDSGARAVPGASGAEPNYGRPAEAQARWEARHGRPLHDSQRDTR